MFQKGLISQKLVKRECLDYWDKSQIVKCAKNVNETTSSRKGHSFSNLKVKQKKTAKQKDVRKTTMEMNIATQ